MLNFFNKRKGTSLSEFNFIKDFNEKDYFFGRTKKWKWINSEEIVLFDKDSEGNIKLLSLDYWLQEMFLDADGQKTIFEYLPILIKQFKDSKMEVPSDLDKFMIETLLHLKDELNVIDFYNSKIELNEEFKNPINE